MKILQRSQRPADYYAPQRGTAQRHRNLPTPGPGGVSPLSRDALPNAKRCMRLKCAGECSTCADWQQNIHAPTTFHGMYCDTHCPECTPVNEHPPTK